MIDKRSRYARTGTVEVTAREGEKRVLVDLREIADPPIEQVHVAGPIDRIDTLANRFYRDPRRYWRIADASDEIDPFEVVAAGEGLPIPSDS
ncbi:MAG: hypothetical protein ACKV2T_00745 [Kofleriaceae bacterium]